MIGRSLPSLLAATLLLASCLLPVTASSTAVPPGAAAPLFSLPDQEGNTVTLEGYRGTPLVVAFFSTWCSRCAQELAFLRDAFGGRSDVAVLLVNQDGERMPPPKRMVEYRSRLSLPFPILLDDGLSLWETYGIRALPTTFVIGRDGRVLLVEPGFTQDAPDRLLDVVGRGGSPVAPPASALR